MQSYLFPLDLSLKISNSTPKGLAPECAIESTSYDWDVRTIAKISPKTDKFGPFSISQILFTV